MTKDDPDAPYLEAIERLQKLFREAREEGLLHPRSAALATADLAGCPSVRMITALEIDTSGPLFFIDRGSGKGRQLAENPCAGMCFFWPELHYQVTIEGQAGPVDGDTADRLWANRPRDRKIAAWAWTMSPASGDHGVVREGLGAAREMFPWGKVPRPPTWEAFSLTPQVIQFWKVGWRKLHARERYVCDADDVWHKERVQPL